ncbi:MAG: putative rane protein [Herbaspirillum sp.]|jgi:predicted PurR-regulated permease PerM|nr:putative rane protein [Herbaspirillum sp.]
MSLAFDPDDPSDAPDSGGSRLTLFDKLPPTLPRRVITDVSRFTIASWVIMALMLVMVMMAHLLTALLAGLLVYELVRTLTPLIHRRVTNRRAHLIAVLLLSAVVIGLLTAAVLALLAYFRDPGRLTLLEAKLMIVIDHARTQLPNWTWSYLPDDVADVRSQVGDWLREHRGEVQLAGREAFTIFAHILIGMVLGAIAALHTANPLPVLQPLGAALLERCALLADAFGRVVFAQIKISTLNTLFTALFLLVGLRLAGVHLPLAKTMILVTFIVGLLPVIGNLISNTLIVMIALSVSLYVGVVALLFLVLVHKFEYFLNARIVGFQINARSWELLLAMLMAEALFGLPGLVAAPIYYAYIKRELYEMGWV